MPIDEAVDVLEPDACHSKSAQLLRSVSSKASSPSRRFVNSRIMSILLTRAAPVVLQLRLPEVPGKLQQTDRSDRGRIEASDGEDLLA